MDWGYGSSALKAIGLIISIAPFIDDTVQARREKKSVDIVTLDELDISIIKEKIEQALDEKVSVYKSAEFPPDFPEKFKSNIKRDTVEYKGNKYELIERFNKEHSEIGRLMWALEMVDKAISGDYCFKIYFKNGFTHRDDAVLRFVNFVRDGSTSLAAIVQQYSGILSETEVRDTVIKMEKGWLFNNRRRNCTDYGCNQETFVGSGIDCRPLSLILRHNHKN